MAKINISKSVLAQLFVVASVLVFAFAVKVAKLGNDHGAYNPEPPVVTMGPILIATSDIEPNERLREKTAVEDWPVDRIPDGAVQSVDDVNGLVAVDPIYKGELILKTKLTAPRRETKE